MCCRVVVICSTRSFSESLLVQISIVLEIFEVLVRRSTYQLFLWWTQKKFCSYNFAAALYIALVNFVFIFKLMWFYGVFRNYCLAYKMHNQPAKTSFEQVNNTLQKFGFYLKLRKKHLTLFNICKIEITKEKYYLPLLVTFLSFGYLLFIK